MNLHRFYPLGILLFGASTSLAANSVVIQSDTIMTRTDSVSVGVYISNDSTLSGIVLPLEIRSIDAGAFISGRLSVDITSQSRIQYLTTYTVTSTFPDKDNTIWYKCDGTGYRTRGAPDYESPDGLLYAGVGTVYGGSDGTPPSGTPSALITFGVSSKPGRFEIDTTCVTPDNHLAFFGIQNELDRVMIQPAFTKGTITLTCNCPCYADPVCDTITDVMDVIRVIGYAFMGRYPESDSGCPVNRADLNADDVTNILDVVSISEVAFRGVRSDLKFVHPCE